MLFKVLLSCSSICACDFQNIHLIKLKAFDTYWCLHIRKEEKGGEGEEMW